MKINEEITIRWYARVCGRGVCPFSALKSNVIRAFVDLQLKLRAEGVWQMPGEFQPACPPARPQCLLIKWTFVCVGSIYDRMQHAHHGCHTGQMDDINLNGNRLNYEWYEPNARTLNAIRNEPNRKLPNQGLFVQGIEKRAFSECRKMNGMQVHFGDHFATSLITMLHAHIVRPRFPHDRQANAPSVRRPRVSIYRRIISPKFKSTTRARNNERNERNKTQAKKKRIPFTVEPSHFIIT